MLKINDYLTKFKYIISDNELVHVKQIAEKIKDDNNKILYDEKKENLALLYNTINAGGLQVINLECIKEGFRCLGQISLNLIKDLKIFKKQKIKKCSSAYHYIESINDFKICLTDLKYDESDKDFSIPEHIELDDVVNKANERTTMLLILCYQEINELLKFKYDGCQISDLIEARRDWLIVNNITKDKLWEKFKICGLCDSDVNEADYTCSTCESSITYHNEYKLYAGVLEKFFKIQNNLNMDKHESVDLTETQVDVHWICSACTYKNIPNDNNCEVCGKAKD